MEYKVKIDERVFPIEASRLDETGNTDMAVSGETVPVRVKAVSPNHMHVQIREKSLNLFVARSEAGTWIWADGRARLVKDADKEQRRRSKAPGHHTPRDYATNARICGENPCGSR
jgi:hypothetical protein